MAFIMHSLPTSFPAPPRSTFQPPGSCPSMAQVQELKQRKPHPLPPLLCSRQPSPPRSDSSASKHRLASIEYDYEHSPSPPSSPRHHRNQAIYNYISRDPQRRAAYLKSRETLARSLSDLTPECDADPNLETPRRPLRKQSAFIKNEELLAELAASADTPHVSEMLPGEDIRVQEPDTQEADGPDLQDGLLVSDNEQGPRSSHSTNSETTGHVCSTCSDGKVEVISALEN